VLRGRAEVRCLGVPAAPIPCQRSGRRFRASGAALGARRRYGTCPARWRPQKARGCPDAGSGVVGRERCLGAPSRACQRWRGCRGSDRGTLAGVAGAHRGHAGARTGVGGRSGHPRHAGSAHAGAGGCRCRCRGSAASARGSGARCQCSGRRGGGVAQRCLLSVGRSGRYGGCRHIGAGAEQGRLTCPGMATPPDPCSGRGVCLGGGVTRWRGHPANRQP